MGYVCENLIQFFCIRCSWTLVYAFFIGLILKFSFTICNHIIIINIIIDDSQGRILGRGCGGAGPRCGSVR